MSGSRFGSRTTARGQALQLLFQAQATGRLVNDVLAGEYALSDGPLDGYARELACGADGMLHELDSVINEASTNWSVSRMPSVDRNLLRLAVYEMAMVDAVDIAVSINEFVELAKAYGTDESSRFVNGLLGRVADMLEADPSLLASTSEDEEVPEDQYEPVAEAEAVPASTEDGDELPEWARES